VPRIAISLPQDLYEQLLSVAQEIHITESGQIYHLSMSEIARRAIYDYLNAPYHDDSPLPHYVTQLGGKELRAGGKIASHGGKRPNAGRKSTSRS
jgi:hypothetical protein